MTKKTIAIDIDDVIADTTDALRLVVNQKANVDLQREHYQVEGEYWGYYESVWVENKIDHLVSFDSLHDDMATGQNHVQIIPGAKEAITKLHEKFNIVAVTSRNVKWVDATHDWIEKNLTNVFEEIIFVHHDNTDVRTKGDVCLDVGAKYLVDDNIEHCQTAFNVGVKPILYGEYGWNMHQKVPYGFARAKNWHEVLEYFENEG